MPDNLTRIASLGHALSYIFMLALPASVVARLIYTGPQGFLPEVTSLGVSIEPGLPLQNLVAALAIMSLTLICSVCALWHMSQLFAHFRSGDVIQPRTTHHVTRLGQILVLRALLGILSLPALSVLLTMHHGVGNRHISFALHSQDIWSLVSGALLMVIGYAFTRAVEIERENKAFV